MTAFNRHVILRVCCYLALLGFMALFPRVNFAQTQAVSAPQAVAELKAISGVVTVRSVDGKNRFVADGSKIFVGDTVATEKNSTVILAFKDTSQVALRPNTQFVVNEFTFTPEQPKEDKAQMQLLKGGLRALTGLIGKRGQPDAYQLQSQTATIGIRGTDYSARLCQADCDDRDEVKVKPLVANATTADVAARVSTLDGDLRATSAQGQSRRLVKGSAVFAGDTLMAAANSTAVIVFSDGSRVTLPAGSHFAVQQYRLVPHSPQTSFAAFKLLKGVVRTVTGQIAKANPNNVTYSTATATIGIRGTAFDLACVSPNTVGMVELTFCQADQSTVINMREGQTDVASLISPVTPSTAGLRLLSTQSARLDPGQQTPRLLDKPLPLFSAFLVEPPLPESSPNNFEELSVTESRYDSQSGADDDVLFLAVNDGTVVLTHANQFIDVQRGEGAVVKLFTDLPPKLLVAPPEILLRDVYLVAPAFAAPTCSAP